MATPPPSGTRPGAYEGARGGASFGSRRAVDRAGPVSYRARSMAGPSDFDLLALARTGDEGAFATLCERHRALAEHRIRRFVNGPLLRKLDVADVFQETMLTAHQRLASFELRSPRGFGAWLAGIAELKAREALRHHVEAERRDIGREIGPGGRPSTGAFAGDGPTPSHVAMQGEEQALLHAAIEALAPDHAAVLRLVVGERLTLSQAAMALGRSYEAAKKLYARALSALALHLGEHPTPGTPEPPCGGPAT